MFDQIADLSTSVKHDSIVFLQSYSLNGLKCCRNQFFGTVNSDQSNRPFNVAPAHSENTWFQGDAMEWGVIQIRNAFKAIEVGLAQEFCTFNSKPRIRHNNAAPTGRFQET